VTTSLQGPVFQKARRFQVKLIFGTLKYHEQPPFVSTTTTFGAISVKFPVFPVNNHLTNNKAEIMHSWEVQVMDIS